MDTQTDEHVSEACHVNLSRLAVSTPGNISLSVATARRSCSYVLLPGTH